MSDRLSAAGSNDHVLRGIDKLEKHLKYASMRALNTTAFGGRKAVRDVITSSIDRPTPKTVALPQVIKRATRDDLEAIIALDYRRFTGSTGYLTPQIEGGKRVSKAFERRLKQAGVMPWGMFAVYAKRSGSLNQYGNLPGPKIRQILSWFQAFKEAGYTGNMARRTKDRFRAGKRKGMKWGMSYFISTGQRFGGLGLRLHRGIWERHYPNGTAGKSFIRPVLLFVDSVTYRPRIDYVGTIERTVGAMLEREFEAEISRALRSAR